MERPRERMPVHRPARVRVAEHEIIVSLICGRPIEPVELAAEPIR